MYSLFPNLMHSWLLALIPVVLRLVVAYAVGVLAYYHLSSPGEKFAKDLEHYFKKDSKQLVKIAGYIEIVITVLLIIGLFTQGAALLAAIVFGKIIFFKKRLPHFGTSDLHYYWVLFILSLIVFVEGAGVLFAFDLPL